MKGIADPGFVVAAANRADCPKMGGGNRGRVKEPVLTCEAVLAKTPIYNRHRWHNILLLKMPLAFADLLVYSDWERHDEQATQPGSSVHHRALYCTYRGSRSDYYRGRCIRPRLNGPIS
jgi:hypothetical protein